MDLLDNAFVQFRKLTEQENEERFWANVLIDDGCWEWTGSKNKSGYGQCSRNGRISGMAHRVSYEYLVGGLRKEDLLCHKCDNPGCVKPSHLFPGTHKDNAQDSKAKGRNNRGSVNGMSKLNAGQVAEIIRLSADGVTREEVAAMFGISSCHVTDLVRGNRWAYLEVDRSGLDLRPWQGERVWASKLTTEQVLDIRRGFKCGQTIAALSTKHGAHWVTAYDVVKRRTWKHLPPE